MKSIPILLCTVFLLINLSACGGGGGSAGISGIKKSERLQ